MQNEFNARWGRLLRQKRIRTGLRVFEVSQRLKIDGFVIRRAEKEPALVPLCELTSLMRFYGLTLDERFELCSIQIKLGNQSER